MTIDSHTVQTPQLPPEQLFLLFHAAGDNPVAMGQIGRWFADAFPRALVVSLGGPEKCGDDPGRQWYAPPEGSTDHKNRVAAVLPQVIHAIKQWQQQSGVQAGATALVGFSQGSTVILEAVASEPALAARVIAFSGRYAALPERADLLTTLHLIHGDNDRVIPLTHALDAQERLLTIGGDVTLDIVDDLPHAIDERAMRLALERVKYTIPKRYFDEATGGSQPGSNDAILLM